MDVPRGKQVARRKMIRRVIFLAIIIAAIPLIGMGLSRLKPAAPSVDKGTIWVDTVKRGPLVREVRGLGALVVEDYMWIPAAFDSRVEKINFLPGAKVRANDVVMVLSNPQMQLDATDFEWQIKQAEANYQNLKVTLQSQQLAQRATTEQVKSDMEQAELTADRDTELTRLGLKSALDTKLSVAKWQELKGRYALSKEQFDISGQAIQAQLDAQKVQIEKLRATHKLKKEQVDDLTIRAGADGTLTQLGTSATPLEVGMRVTSGTILAKIAQPRSLKATLKIQENQAKDIAVGQPAAIDTRNGVIPGHVARIDPAAVNGTVDVDVKLEGQLPSGARPDLSVDGTITIERLPDVLFVGRPVIGQPGAKITLFKLDPGTADAQRVAVTLGRGSVNNVEIVDGLKAGDQVILSDMSAQDAVNRIRLN